MKKIIVTFILFACICLNIIAQNNPESDFTIRREIIRNINVIIITGYTGTRLSVNIPPTINGLPVMAIDNRAFREKRLTSVTIPDGVLTIESTAFALNGLTDITIPSLVAYIGDGAFVRNQLTRVIFDYNNNNSINYANASIGRFAFAENKLTSISIPNNVTSIGDGAFAMNPLTRVTIGANVNIGNDAIDGDFVLFYNRNGRIAGTYIRNRSNFEWQMEGQQETQQSSAAQSSTAGITLTPNNPTATVTVAPAGARVPVTVSGGSATVQSNATSGDPTLYQAATGSSITADDEVGNNWRHNFTSGQTFFAGYYGSGTGSYTITATFAAR